MTVAAANAAVYISVDMEGCATLVHWDEVRPSDDAAYQRARRLMTAEVNAALRGAFAAGATKATVNDSHSVMRNLIAEDIDTRAIVVSGRLKPHFMLEGLDQDCTAAFFVGYHGAIGDANAVMGHTYSPRIIYECRLNGEPVGETTINAALAGCFGVPVALVSGDETTLEEVHRNLPWAVGVDTKASFGYFSADGLSPAVVVEKLHAGARAAIERAADMKPFVLATPITMEIDTLRTSQADVLELIPSMTRCAPRTVAMRADDFRQIYQGLMAVIYLGSTV